MKQIIKLEKSDIVTNRIGENFEVQIPNGPSIILDQEALIELIKDGNEFLQQPDEKNNDNWVWGRFLDLSLKEREKKDEDGNYTTVGYPGKYSSLDNVSPLTRGKTYTCGPNNEAIPNEEPKTWCDSKNTYKPILMSKKQFKKMIANAKTNS